MCIAAAVVGGAVVGGIATNMAADKSAGATRDATNASIAQQDRALQQQAALSAPYRALGESAMGTYMQLLGLSPPQQATNQPNPPPSAPVYHASNTWLGRAIGNLHPAIPPPTPQKKADAPAKSNPISVLDTLRNTPGYQFQLQEGMNATRNAAAAQGMGLSGNTLRALDQFSTGLADSTYQQQLGNYLNAVQIGQASAAGQAANIGNAANNKSSALIGQGNTLASIRANEMASYAKLAGNAMNDYAVFGGGGGGMGEGMDAAMTMGF